MEKHQSPEEKYRDAARRHGEYTLKGDSVSTNLAYYELMSALRDIRRLANRGEEVLLRLTTDNDVSVVGWAASHLLPLQEDVAKNALENVAGGKGLVAFSAEMVLKEWNAGRLKID